MSDVIIVGGGAAGMMAAIAASEKGREVLLLEQNEKLGKKIYITGKGRGNLTNASDISEFFDKIISNPKFLYSALYTFDNQALISMITGAGIPLKQERGGRMFPASDHASDITKALTKLLKANHVSVRLRSKVKRLICEDHRVMGVVLSDGEQLFADRIIIATGGCSYPSTGSSGDGLKMAGDLGLSIVKPVPALVPLITEEEDIPRLQGLSLKNIRLTIFEGKRIVFSDFGEMLFTHFGVSGPLVLSASSHLSRRLDEGKTFSAAIDLKPAVSDEDLDRRLLEQIDQHPKKKFRHFFDGMLPGKMTGIMVERTAISPEKRFCDINREERLRILSHIRDFSFTIRSTGSFKEAIITQGGVSVSEIDPGTMKSRVYEGLSFAGEVIDVDALTGGYNMQIAFSTGYLSGTVD